MVVCAGSSEIPARRALLWQARRSAALALGMLAAAISAAPRADAQVVESVDEAKRWVPAFSVFFDALGQKAHGSVSSGDVLGPPLPEGCQMIDGSRNGDLCPASPVRGAPIVPRKIQPDDAGSDTNVAPLVGGSLELMTPRLLGGPVQPRLFAHGDAAASFGFERNLAGTGAPDEFAPPDPFENRTDEIQEESVVGQGTRTKYQVQTLVISGGAGVAFSFDALGRRIRIKPSFEYQRQDIDLIGAVRRAVKQVQRGTTKTELKPEEFRFIELTANDEETIQGFGPGLELEADTLHAGPFLMSVYLMGRGYYNQGDLDFTLTDTNEFDETATWTWELERWSWRSGVGLRFRWAPE